VRVPAAVRAAGSGILAVARQRQGTRREGPGTQQWRIRPHRPGEARRESPETVQRGA